MIELETLERKLSRRALAYSIGAGGILSALIYAGLRFYEDNHPGFFSLACFASAIWLSLASKRWNPLLGVRQLYLFDWLVIAVLAWFMTNSVTQLGPKVLIGVCMMVFATAAAVSARRKRVRA